jgi:hypothetical protein
LLAYVTAKPHLENQNLTVWEFYPLAGDPTEEEKAAIEKKHFDNQISYAKSVLDEWKKLNFKV